MLFQHLADGHAPVFANALASANHGDAANPSSPAGSNRTIWNCREFCCWTTWTLVPRDWTGSIQTGSQQDSAGPPQLERWRRSGPINPPALGGRAACTDERLLTASIHQELRAAANREASNQSSVTQRRGLGPESELVLLHMDPVVRSVS